MNAAREELPTEMVEADRPEEMLDMTGQVVLVE
jgi:hypothetical protein